MGKFKGQISVIIGLVILIIILSLTSCSPIKRHARLVKKYPFVHQTDTVILTDTITVIIPENKTDTIFQLDSFMVALHDTIVLEKDNLLVQIRKVHDSIYIDAKCDTIFVDKIITQKSPLSITKQPRILILKKMDFICYIFS